MMLDFWIALGIVIILSMAACIAGIIFALIEMKKEMDRRAYTSELLEDREKRARIAAGIPRNIDRTRRWWK